MLFSRDEQLELDNLCVEDLTNTSNQRSPASALNYGFESPKHFV